MVDTFSKRRLFEPHPAALTTLYGDLENFARAQGPVHPGTPGSLVERANSGGFKFYAHQFYDARNKRVEQYVAGPVGTAPADGKAAALREKLQSLAEVVKNVRLLGREGYKIVDSKTFATLATLHNQGLFQAGALFIGSHAYGALLNQLGARAEQYTTKDIDIAKSATLVMPEGHDLSFLEMLKTSGISYFGVPNLDPKVPSTSFKEAGSSFLQVDLLVPSQTNEIGVVAVPELKAHATSLPYLQYLLGDVQDATVLAREGCCRVRVPTAERFAWHKLIVSQLRKNPAKTLKDLGQAAILIAILTELHPGALEDAAKSIPKSAWKYVTKASELTLEDLAPHPRALELLQNLGQFQKSKKPAKNHDE